MPDTDTSELLDEWMIVELLGHRRLAARVREVQIAGAGFLRLDVPDGATQYVAPSSVYALHPVSEAVCRAVATHCRPDPVQRWELPKPPRQELQDDGGWEPVPEDQLHPSWRDGATGLVSGGLVTD